jgi:predicted ABC-type ATPase
VRKKELIIIAGPNGSGKTTFAKSFLKEFEYEFLNADEIAKKLTGEGKRGGNINAGKEYFKRVEKLKKENKNIILESTLSGLFLGKLITDFKKKRYRIKILFIVLNSPDICIERIKHRVSRGGHHVPDEDVRRRFYRGKKNFWSRYKRAVDHWMLYNNTESGFELVAIGERDKFDITNKSLFNNFKENIK